MHIGEKIVRALLADRLRHSTTLDEAERENFLALQRELDEEALRTGAESERTTAEKQEGEEE